MSNGGRSIPPTGSPMLHLYVNWPPQTQSAEEVEELGKLDCAAGGARSVSPSSGSTDSLGLMLSNLGASLETDSSNSLQDKQRSPSPLSASDALLIHQQIESFLPLLASFSEHHNSNGHIDVRAFIGHIEVECHPRNGCLRAVLNLIYLIKKTMSEPFGEQADLMLNLSIEGIFIAELFALSRIELKSVLQEAILEDAALKMVKVLYSFLSQAFTLFTDVERFLTSVLRLYSAADASLTPQRPPKLVLDLEQAQVIAPKRGRSASLKGLTSTLQRVTLTLTRTKSLDRNNGSSNKIDKENSSSAPSSRRGSVSSMGSRMSLKSLSGPLVALFSRSTKAKVEVHTPKPLTPEEMDRWILNQGNPATSLKAHLVIVGEGAEACSTLCRWGKDYRSFVKKYNFLTNHSSKIDRNGTKMWSIGGLYKIGTALSSLSSFGGPAEQAEALSCLAWVLGGSGSFNIWSSQGDLMTAFLERLPKQSRKGKNSQESWAKDLVDCIESIGLLLTAHQARLNKVSDQQLTPSTESSSSYSSTSSAPKDEDEAQSKRNEDFGTSSSPLRRFQSKANLSVSLALTSPPKPPPSTEAALEIIRKKLTTVLSSEPKQMEERPPTPPRRGRSMLRQRPPEPPERDYLTQLSQPPQLPVKEGGEPESQQSSQYPRPKQDSKETDV